MRLEGNMDGNYIDTYDSAAQASEVTDTDSSGIIAVCRGKQKSAGCQAEREAGFDSTKISRVCNHKLPYYGKKNEDKYLWSFSELHDTETED